MSNLLWRLRDNGKHSAWGLYDEAADFIEKQQQRIANLEQLARLANAYLDPARCKKCGHLCNRGLCCINCGDTNPSQRERDDE